MTDLISSDWQELDANNINPSPNGVQGGYSPSQVAPILRTIRGAMKRSYVQQNPVYTTTGTGNAYILTYEQAPRGYSKGIIYTFFTDRANTGAATLNINNLGTRNIVHRDGSALTANQIKAGGVLLVVFDGTNFVYVSPVTHDGKLTGVPTVDGSTVWHAGNDGAGSTLDADLLDGQHGVFYQNASNINAGTLSDDRLPSLMSGKNFTSGISANGTIIANSQSLVINAAPNQTTNVFFQNAGVARAINYHNPTSGVLNWQLNNGLGTAVRNMSYRESDGLLSLQGFISSSGDIIAGGAVRSGGDSGAVFGNDGNITGAMWGGALSSWLANNKVSKTGDVMTGGLTISNTGPSLTLKNTATTNQARSVFHDGTWIGFLGLSGDWIFRTNDAGAVWTAQLGDLNQRIEDRANAWADAKRVEAINQSTASIMPTIAAQGAGALGTYAYLYKLVNTQQTPGSVWYGTDLYWSASSGYGANVGYGTWRCMGFNQADRPTLFLRIS